MFPTDLEKTSRFLLVAWHTWLSGIRFDIPEIYHWPLNVSKQETVETCAFSNTAYLTHGSFGNPTKVEKNKGLEDTGKYLAWLLICIIVAHHYSHSKIALSDFKTACHKPIAPHISAHRSRAEVQKLRENSHACEQNAKITNNSNLNAPFQLLQLLERDGLETCHLTFVL